MLILPALALTLLQIATAAPISTSSSISSKIFRRPLHLSSLTGLGKKNGISTRILHCSEENAFVFYFGRGSARKPLKPLRNKVRFAAIPPPGIRDVSNFQLSALRQGSTGANAMVAEDIDGKAIAASIRAEIRQDVNKMFEENGVVPGLAVILVGTRRDSQTYVRMKKKACEEAGITSYGHEYPESVTENEMISVIGELNGNPKIHGILVQLPLPSHIDEGRVTGAVDHRKDVDGLHPRNAASLSSTATHAGATQLDWTDLRSIPFHIACTPQGCIELLVRSGVEIEGKNAVVIGRSNLVGMPVALLLMHCNATVTIVHSRSKDVPEIVRKADIVIAAVGRADMVKKEWLKEGCVVIDVGINSVDDPSKKRGYRLVGDVDYAGAKQVAGMITPVPGGVGPMTIAMLLRNTLNSCTRL